MKSIIRSFLIAFALAALSLGASIAKADSITVTLGGGLTGVLNLTITPNGGGSYLVTSMSGSETISGSTMNVGTVVPTNASGTFWFPPPAGGFTYDDLIFPGSSTVFDNAGLLFTLLGSSGTVYENLYSVGTSLYLESAYLNNGVPFPNDFSYVPVTVSLSGSHFVVGAPEPSSLSLALAGMLILAGLLIKKSSLA
jgi:hypothetical protein